MENQIKLTTAELSEEQQAILKANMELQKKRKVSKPKATQKKAQKPVKKANKKKQRKLTQATNTLADFFPKK